MPKFENMTPEQQEMLRDLVAKADPEMLEKYGNPLDENDRRMWTPKERAEKGVPLEEQILLLATDVEALSVTVGKLAQDLFDMRKAELLREIKANPEAAIEKLISAYAGDPDKTFGPNGPSGPAYAGSLGDPRISPDTIVDTIDGPIRADQVPGYRNEPGWVPSPDWAEANCACDAHKAKRAAAANGNGDDFPNGFYL